MNPMIHSGHDGVSAHAHGVAKILLGSALMVVASALPASAPAQTAPVCGDNVKVEIVEAMTAKNAPEDTLALEKELYAKYQYCANENLSKEDPLPIVARQCSAKLIYLGSTYYEEMPCCGYDPQKRQFACPVKVKQTFGFGHPPLPGSREYVLHCVATPQGTFVPVGYDSVHLGNEMVGYKPTWQFAVVAGAVDNLNAVYPMSGQTRIARSILSWQFKPTSCDYKPIWGDVIEYPIRLDQ